jgi:hypothetical protein
MAHVVADIEAARDENEYLRGYADFSHFIASDYSLSVYRKFAVLGARNILYLQAELQLLELQLGELDDEDKKTIGWSRDSNEALEIEKAARSWEDLNRLATEGDEEKARKLAMICKIRKLMKEYGSYIRENLPRVVADFGRRGFASAKSSSRAREARKRTIQGVQGLVSKGSSGAVG